jgi:rubredoxin
MKQRCTFKINFRGGIISPGDLYNTMVAASRSGVYYVSFGLRQQLLIDAPAESINVLQKELKCLGAFFEIDEDEFPNMMSSYPAEEVFIQNTWLSEGIYKDIFDAFDYHPRLKINVTDSNQSFTPLLTGNINWVASSSAHFWHLFIRFPRTNTICEWDQLVYTNDIARLSGKIEDVILQNRSAFYGNAAADGAALFHQLGELSCITRPAEQTARLPPFNLPYYEGLNRYNDKYWLGIYRRDELFSIAFLKEMCLLCLQTKVGQVCSTPWKSIIIKGIDEKDRLKWNRLLEKFQINIRHAANELNFQVEEHSEASLRLKQYLVRELNNEDTRTFGICIGIKSRRKSEIFSSILVKRKPLFRFWGIELFHVYDILCAKDYNPNERTAFVFSAHIPKFLLAEQLRRCIHSYYNSRSEKSQPALLPAAGKKEMVATHVKEYVHQCGHCLSVYDEKSGDEFNNIRAGTAFESLPQSFVCALCEAPKTAFAKKEKPALGLQAV